MSVLTWNVNGLSESTLCLWDTRRYLESFDVVLLCETRCLCLPPGFLPDHSVAHVPASTQGRAGEGMLVAVRRQLAVRVNDWASDETSLWLRLSFPGRATPLFVGCCYLPPSTSRRLRTSPLVDRLAALEQRVATAAAEGDVLLAGDFNALIGAQADCGGTRGATDMAVNHNGTCLLQLSCRHGLMLCTGRAIGDELATPTFRATSRGQATRLDHVLVSRAAFSRVCSSVVCGSRRGSDHLPIETVLRMAAQVQQPRPCQGVPLQVVRWRVALRDAYAHSFAGVSSAALEQCMQLAQQGDAEGAFRSLDSAIRQAAEAAGMVGRVSCAAGTGGRARQPWFDQECRDLKRGVWACIRRGGGFHEFQRLERAYHSVTRRKQRQHRLQQLQHFLREQRDDPRQFWRRLRSAVRRLPPQLQGVQHWGAYLQRVAGGGSAAEPHLPEEAFPQRDPGPAAALNAPISLEEVLAGLAHLNTGRATGHCGLPAELLRYAQATAAPDAPAPPHMLAAALRAVLNCAFHTGQVPAFCNVALVSPVFKRRDPCCPENYRPISVTEPIMRLYASILNARLLSFTETHGLRSAAQTGFRPGHSTLHPLLALQHFVDSAGRTRQPLFCCFLDLEQAFESVHRSLLWSVLQRLGVHGSMLAALQSLYVNPTVAVKVGGRVSGCIPSCTGVRQGCPLSPTLFGLVLDGLHRYLLRQCPDLGPLLRDGLRVPDLEYADDVLLLAATPAGLQRLIDAASCFCGQVGMRVNPAKTYVMAFGPAPPALPQWACCGQPLPCVATGKYLGVQIDAACGIIGTCSSLHDKMRASWALLRRQYAGLHCSASVHLLLKLYRICVPPVASYACELWGVRDLPPAMRVSRGRLNATHLSILRSLSGLRHSTPSAIVFSETQEAPMQHSWWPRIVRFWNALARQPPGSLFQEVALADCRDAIQHNVNNWARGFFRGLQNLGYDFAFGCNVMGVVPLDSVRQLLSWQAGLPFQGLHVCPRTAPSDGAVLCTYVRWFRRPGWAPVSQYAHPMTLPLPAPTIRQFLRFRAGCCGLPIDVGRHHRVPRSQRLCPQCGAAALGDERHLVFECPVLEPLRTSYAALFLQPDQTMLQFMWQQDMLSVACFVRDALRLLLPAPDS